MANAGRSRNPLQRPLVAVGVGFALSACAYGVMSLHQLDTTRNTPPSADNHWLLVQLDRYGATLLLVELAILAVTALAFVATDGYWKRRADRRRTAAELDDG